MNRKFLASVILGVAMAATSALTGALTPKHKIATAQAQFSLEQMIPKRFGKWTVDDTVVPLTPDDPGCRQTIALEPVIARPTIRLLTSRVPSYE